MLNRRFLRIKIMQMLYAYFQHENADVAFFEKELFKSLDKIYNLYLHILALFIDLHHTAYVVMEEQKNKRLPTKEELNPNMKFVNNTLLVALEKNAALGREIAKHKVSWQSDFDLVRKLYTEIRNGELYRNYVSTENNTVKEDRELLVALITDFLSEHDVLTNVLEERNIHWTDDAFVAYNSVIRNFETFEGTFNMMPLLKDEEDDRKFVSELFRKTILYNKQYEEIIATHTRNWELDRIANMDMLLMKMAIAEILHLSNIPVKVSLNEYIDISKEYSTPNSKTFVNGVLDKIIADLKTSGVGGFDIIFALQDEEFDRTHNLRSIPAYFGRARALRLSELMHFFAASGIVFGLIYGGFSWLYMVGAGIFISLLIYQHLIVKPNDLSRVNLAFGTTNGIASVLFCIFVCLDIFLL